MARLLEHLYREPLADGAGRFTCAGCSTELGVGEDYRAFAGRFDESINSFEPQELATPEDTFVLRHYACPKCALLFEVEMVPPDLG